MKFTEEKLEQAFIELLKEQGYTYTPGYEIKRSESEVLIKEDLKVFLETRYANEKITPGEIEQITRSLENFPASDLYESNKAIMKLVSDGFILKREDHTQKDIYIQLLDYRSLEAHRVPSKDQLTTIVAEKEEGYETADVNVYRVVNQLEITGYEKRIPDCLLYVNGLPLVVFEFKSAIREETAIHNAYEQLTVRYKRDIPELFKYNAFCVISDGVNNRAGSFFAPYDFYYAWRKITGNENSVDGIDSMYSLVAGMFYKDRFKDIVRNFVYLPDTSKKDEKIICRYPQYYAAKKLLDNIKIHQRPQGDGKGGTYFGATGCGKSFTMLFLSRLLMKSVAFASPTIVVITDRTDLDEQLSRSFTNAKGYVGDQNIISVESRDHLREMLQGRSSGGVFLTTIHKFSEDTELLTDRNNVICISDEAHRSQINLDQKVKLTEKGVQKTFGFAKYLHDSLPNATYVGFTGTPVDATFDVFGEITDSYTMTESVKDKITKRIVYEGRAAKVLLNNEKLKEIEAYYAQCAEEGANEYQVEESKKASAQMNAIIGDPDRITAVAEDFVNHYEKRVSEGSTVKGKAMFVCSTRSIAYELYKAILKIKPEWGEVKAFANGVTELSDKEKKELKPIECIKMVMTRGKDDKEGMYELLGTKEDRKELDRQFKMENSNFKIAIVVDMWLTGFDVPFLDTIYIDKPIQQHNLIQTISRVNRNYPGKEKGLVVDYIGIKSQMNKALKKYSKGDETNFEDIKQSVATVKDQLDLLSRLFHKFDSELYYNGNPLEQLACLNKAAEFVQLTKDLENRFMNLMKRLKTAYDICCGSEEISSEERDSIHFYLAIRSIVFKLTKGAAPDTAQMNARVREMVKEAIQSEGVEEIFKLGDDKESEVDIFDEEYLAKIDRIKLPNTKIKLLQQLLAKAIDEFKKVNKAQGIDFSKKMKTLVDNYNERKADVLQSEVLEEFTDEIIDLYYQLKKEKESFGELGIDFEEKAFYDILKMIAHKFEFDYPEDKLIHLSKEVKIVVDDKARYPDWNSREDIKAELKMDLIKLLAKNGYPPITKDEVFKEILEQAENFKRYSA